MAHRNLSGSVAAKTVAAGSTSHRPTRRDIPRAWTILLLTLGSWAALIGAALLVHAVVIAGVLP